jgi:cell division protein FtsI/penicillin-binding protein 2
MGFAPMDNPKIAVAVYVENGGFIQADKTDTETVIFDNNLGQKIVGIVSEVNTDKGYIKVYSNGSNRHCGYYLCYIL